MSIIQPPDDVQAHLNALRDYDVRLAQWLGLDPEVLLSIDESRTQLTPHDGVDITWTAIADGQVATSGAGRHPLPRSIEGGTDTHTVFRDGVHLDQREADRARADLGPRPKWSMVADQRPRCARCGEPVDLWSVQDQGAASCNNCDLTVYEDGHLRDHGEFQP